MGVGEGWCQDEGTEYAKTQNTWGVLEQAAWWHSAGRGERDEKGRALQILRRYLGSSRDVMRCLLDGY